MRYQPAYVYPGAHKVDRRPVQERKGWKIQRPNLNIDQSSSLRLMRFALMIVGLLLLVVGIAHFATAYTAKNWDRVSATITRSDVVRIKTDDGAPIFSAKIEYQYMQNGEVMTGSRVAVTPVRSLSPGEVKRMISAYAVGRTVLAHVNPDRPEKTFLSAEPMPYLYSMILPGLVLVLLSLAIGQALYVHAAREQRKVWRFGEFKRPVASAI